VRENDEAVEEEEGRNIYQIFIVQEIITLNKTSYS
jgi:hypothetical protein